MWRRFAVALVPLSLAVGIVACTDSDNDSGLGALGGEPKDSGSDGATQGGMSVPEASVAPPDVSTSTDASDDAYPTDPNAPPPDCILPCVWEAMKRCPGPEPGQLCVHDTLTSPGSAGRYCCPLDPPAPDGPVLCDDDSWVAGTVSSGVSSGGEPCWWREGEASRRAPGFPPRPADWTSTWYVPDETTGEGVRIATLEHANLDALNAIVGFGECYSGDEVVFSTYMDAGAEHCRQWYMDCDVPGVCPLPPFYQTDPDAGRADASLDGATASPGDASAIDGATSTGIDGATSGSDAATASDAQWSD